MATVLDKKGDRLTRAISYIDGKLQENPDTPVHKLISDSGARFNLTPKDEEYLTGFFKRRQEESS